MKQEQYIKYQLTAYQQGYTLLELILALLVGMVVLAGSYASYSVISKSYIQITNIADLQSTGLPTLNVIIRDLRMAGYRAVDSNIESNYGSIATPVILTDSGASCCDSLQITYDKDLNTRYRTTYFTQARTTNGVSRNALYIDTEQWDGTAWNIITNNALLADYIEDFQLVGSDIIGGFPALVDISLVFRSKKSNLEVTNYAKPSDAIGNFALTANDSFAREEFSGTVNLRNLR